MLNSLASESFAKVSLFPSAKCWECWEYPWFSFMLYCISWVIWSNLIKYETPASSLGSNCPLELHLNISYAKQKAQIYHRYQHPYGSHVVNDVTTHLLVKTLDNIIEFFLTSHIYSPACPVSSTFKICVVCLSPSGQWQQYTQTGWFINNRNLFLTVLEAGRVKTKRTADLLTAL